MTPKEALSHIYTISNSSQFEDLASFEGALQECRETAAEHVREDMKTKLAETIGSTDFGYLGIPDKVDIKKEDQGRVKVELEFRISAMT
jgi:hypothetical protein